MVQPRGPLPSSAAALLGGAGWGAWAPWVFSRMQVTQSLVPCYRPASESPPCFVLSPHRLSPAPVPSACPRHLSQAAPFRSVRVRRSTPASAFQPRPPVQARCSQRSRRGRSSPLSAVSAPTLSPRPGCSLGWDPMPGALPPFGGPSRITRWKPAGVCPRIPGSVGGAWPARLAPPRGRGCEPACRCPGGLASVRCPGGFGPGRQNPC